MKKKYNFSVKINGKILMTLCFALGVLLFQGQNNVISPEIDHWQIPGYTMQRQSYTPPQTYTVVTDATGFDNFDMGIDNAESSIAVNPRNPLWFASGWNGVGFSNCQFSSRARVNNPRTSDGSPASQAAGLRHAARTVT